MYCKNCHNEFEANDMRCSACGSEDVVPITDKPEEAEKVQSPIVKEEIATKNRKKRIGTVISAVVSLVLGSIIHFIGLTNYNNFDYTPRSAYEMSTEFIVYAAMARIGLTLMVYGIITMVYCVGQLIWDYLKEKKK